MLTFNLDVPKSIPMCKEYNKNHKRPHGCRVFHMMTP